MPRYFLTLIIITLFSGLVHADAPPSDTKIKVTLQWSNNDHPKNTHGYKLFAEKWQGLIEKSGKVKCTQVHGFPSEAQWQQSDLIITNLTQRFLTDEQYAIMDAYLKRGGGILVMHQGLVHRQRGQDYANRIGFAYQFDKTKGRSSFGKHEQPVSLSTDHPILKGFPRQLQYKDELYWKLAKGARGKITVLGETLAPQKKAVDKTNYPVFWTVEHGDSESDGANQGRVFGSVIGHYDSIFDDQHFQKLLLRATAWCLKQPLDTFTASQ